EKGLDVSLDVKGSDEIAELGESFNRMIGHLKKSQEDLLASEAKYRQIFEGSKDGIIVTDCDGLMVDVNNAGIELFGCKNRDDFMRSVTIHDFFVHQETCTAFLEQMETAGFVKDFEARFRKRNNDEIDVLVTATRQQDKHQERCRYECIIKDIGEWKSMEQQIRQAEKLASIGQLAAGVAHEINNPLSIVMGYTGLLLKAADNERLRRDLQVIRNNAAMCKKIVEDLLNFSRQADSRLVPADIAETIRSVIEVVDGEFAANGITIRTDFEPGIPPVPMSVDRIRQVCLNLLINASQAIEGRGSILVTTRYEAADHMVRVAFTDTGCGIPCNIRHKVFEPFFTTKEPGQGTGLGTSVSYGIVEEHGGEISFTSEEGKGTTFWFRLPLEEKGKRP
ncbi:MAG TPA: PAS domain S-box protein, partial [Desulfobulbus sp.]|nr:PAS domain S-box protein [Desulfobulbus sp.]